MDGIRYLVDNGIKWRAMPADYPPWRTIYGFARRWAAAGVIGDQLRRAVRISSGKTPRAAAVIVDSQSVKASETVSRDTRGYDPAKKINGRKRHLVVDTRGLVLLVMVTPAGITDRDAAREVLFRLRLTHPEIATVWADSAYAGTLVTWAKTRLDLTIKTVRRPPEAAGFVVLPRLSWVVERSLSWIMRARRHCRDHERLPQVSETLLTWASITLMTRRRTRKPLRWTKRQPSAQTDLAAAA